MQVRCPQQNGKTRELLYYWLDVTLTGHMMCAKGWVGSLKWTPICIKTDEIPPLPYV